MNSVHRDILKDKCDILTKNICFHKIEQLLKEYKIFNKYMWEDIKSVSDVLDALPSRGPKAFQNMIEILRKAGYNREACILENPTLPNEIQDNDLYYKMSSKPLGYCLIINNVNFDSHKQTNGSDNGDQEENLRYGSDVDAKSLCDFFESIGFAVTVKRNKTAKEMMYYIQQFSKKDFTVVDSMILIILSHGGQLDNKDLIYGTDWGHIFKVEIYDVFNNKNCECLQNKPKVFFFIACRGKGTDYGVPKKTPRESIDSTPVIIPSLSDIYIIHSSLPYQVSMRDHEKGSYFCEALVSVLKEHYQMCDLETIIKLVNNKLKNKISKVYHIVQVAHMESLGGTKKVMLYRKN